MRSLRTSGGLARGRDFDVMTGVHVESSVNVENARDVGQSILDSMTGKPATEYSFTKSNYAITFIAK